jgi:hypothetical protein
MYNRDVLLSRDTIRLFISTYLGLLSGDTVNGEASLHVIDQAEEFASLLNGHDI